MEIHRMYLLEAAGSKTNPQANAHANGWFSTEQRH
jgi:hypothetical protein